MPDASYSFGPFTLAPGDGKLYEYGAPVPLGSRALQILIALVENRDRILAKQELIDRVWPSQVVDGNNLTVNMSSLRKVLREHTGQHSFIQTVPGRGYRFVAPVQAGTSAPAAPILAASTRAVPGPATASGHTDMPSIAVLPFTNFSGDPSQDVFGDGIAEDIISELSRNRWLTVIARNSSFTLKGAPVEIRQVAALFDVRYVLEGSVRSAGNRVRVTAQLVDAASHTHVTVVRCDLDMTDIFSAQDEITRSVVTAIRPALYEAEQDRSLRKHPDSVDAWAAYQRGVWHLSRFEQPESAEARLWFERAIALDPNFAPGYYGLGQLLLHDGSAFVPGAPPDWQPRGEALALRAIQLDERDSGAHSILGLAKMVRGDHAGALEATQRALALNPNDATALGTQGATLVFLGRTQEGVASLAASLRLSPRDPRLRIRHAHMGLGHYFARHYAEAEAVALGMIRRWPTYTFGHRFHAMILAETGRLSEARAAMARATALSPAMFEDFSHARMPWYRPAEHRRMVEALRKAGWVGQAD